MGRPAGTGQPVTDTGAGNAATHPHKDPTMTAQVLPFRPAQPAISDACRWSEAIETVTAANLKIGFAWQRQILRFMLGTAVSVSLLGCSTTTDLVAGAVTRYCDAATDAEREIVRDVLNAKTYPNEVLVYCAR